jgi:hypothetical protein
VTVTSDAGGVAGPAAFGFARLHPEPATRIDSTGMKHKNPYFSLIKKALPRFFVTRNRMLLLLARHICRPINSCGLRNRGLRAA